MSSIAHYQTAPCIYRDFPVGCDMRQRCFPHTRRRFSFSSWEHQESAFQAGKASICRKFAQCSAFRSIFLTAADIFGFMTRKQLFTFGFGIDNKSNEFCVLLKKSLCCYQTTLRLHWASPKFAFTYWRKFIARFFRWLPNVGLMISC